MSLKHVGRIVKNKKKVVVAYRVVPNDFDNCIVVPTESLMAEEHDSLMSLVESHTAQSANELADAMIRWTLPDGSNMLHTFHRTGKMIKMPQKDVEMTPDTYSSINLRELIEMIAQQKGCDIADLAINDGSKPVEKPQEKTAEEQVAQHVNDPLSDEDLARQYRAQADAMYKEAKSLREQAEELSPTKRKTTKKKASEQKSEPTTEGNN